VEQTTKVVYGSNVALASQLAFLRKDYDAPKSQVHGKAPYALFCGPVSDVPPVLLCQLCYQLFVNQYVEVLPQLAACQVGSRQNPGFVMAPFAVSRIIAIMSGRLPFLTH
jgi:hypothetical protein